MRQSPHVLILGGGQSMIAVEMITVEVIAVETITVKVIAVEAITSCADPGGGSINDCC